MLNKLLNDMIWLSKNTIGAKQIIGESFIDIFKSSFEMLVSLEEVKSLPPWFTTCFEKLYDQIKKIDLESVKEKISPKVNLNVNFKLETIKERRAWGIKTTKS